jgi:hypothetical protein
MNVRRAMIVEKDHKAQVSGAMDGRHAKDNPSDGLFKSPPNMAA